MAGITVMLDDPVSVDATATPLTYNVKIVMGYKTQEKILQASYEVLSSISPVWKTMLKDTNPTEEKTWRCDRSWHDGLEIALQLAHHQFDWARPGLTPEVIQCIGILYHKFGLHRLLRAHAKLWAPYFASAPDDQKDNFQLQMRLYVAEAIGSQSQLETAWRQLLLRVKSRECGTLYLGDKNAGTSEDLNSALVSQIMQESLLHAHKNAVFELNKIKPISLIKLTSSQFTCQKDAVIHDEAEMCKCWNIQHLISMNTFHIGHEDQKPPCKSIGPQFSENVGPLTVHEVVRKSKAKWLAEKVPDGHSACQLFVVDQIEELEKKLWKWEVPLYILVQYAAMGSEKVRKANAQD